MAYRDDRELELRVAFFGLPAAGKTACIEAIAYELPGPPIKRTMSGSSESVLRPLGNVRGLRAGVLVDSLRRETFSSIQRQNLLGSLDAVVWVVDAGAGAVEANTAALAEFAEALRGIGKDPAGVPLVFLWNKRDVPDAAPLDALRALNPAGAPEFEASRADRQGILAALRAAVRLVLVREKLA
jgi:hypothetical protein